MTRVMSPNESPDSSSLRTQLSGIRQTFGVSFLSFALVCCLVGVGLFLRLYHLNEKSLWSDEVCTIATALGHSVDTNAVKDFDPALPQPASYYRDKVLSYPPEAMNTPALAWEQTATVLRQNIHPPFFFWLMNRYLQNDEIQTFGTSPQALRWPAVAFGLLCIPMLFLVARRLGDTSLGLLSATIFTLSGYQIAHAQDARQYTLLTLIALTSAWLVLRLVTGNSDKTSVEKTSSQWPEWTGWVLLSAMGLYTQYLYGLFILFLMTFAAWQRRAERGFLIKLAMAAVGMGLLFAPWLPVLADQLQFLKQEGHYTAGLWNPLQLPEILWRTLTDFVMPKAFLGKLAVSLILLLSLASGFASKRLNKLSPVLAFVGLWLGVILGGQMLLDILKDSHTLSIRRYTLLAAPAFYILIGWTLLQIRWKPALLQPVLGIFLLVAMALNTNDILSGTKFHSDEFRQAAQFINTQAQLHDVVLVHKSGAMAVGMAYYLEPTQAMMGIPESAATTDTEKAAITTRVNAAAQQAQRVWVVLSHSGGGVKGLVEAQLIQQGFVPGAPQKFPGVGVRLYTRSAS